MINQLLAAKEKQYFKLEEWEMRGLDPSPNETQNEMRQVIYEFIDLAIEKIKAKGKIDEDDIIDNLKLLEEWVFDDFDTEEREWVYEICGSITSDLGLDINKIHERELSDFSSGNMLNNLLKEAESAGFDSNDPIILNMKQTLVMQLKSNNEPNENIIKITGLTEEEINKLCE